MPRAGTLVAVVGSSGSGKDSLIAFAREALAGDADFLFPRRVITRALEPAEQHIPIPVEEFFRRRDSGHFILHWEAHGLCYGILRDIESELSRGHNVIVNLSRGVIGRMRQVFPFSAVIQITASPETLARRLAGRGREAVVDQVARLARTLPVAADATIANDGRLEDAGRAFVMALRRVTARNAMMLGL
jgi:ribose 1,5-bisphosphokinase